MQDSPQNHNKDKETKLRLFFVVLSFLFFAVNLSVRFRTGRCSRPYSPFISGGQKAGFTGILGYWPAICHGNPGIEDGSRNRRFIPKKDAHGFEFSLESQSGQPAQFTIYISQ
jgi:hypothetical protein